jgi:DNA-directed RNA polymerase specialized sigma24 family protein
MTRKAEDTSVDNVAMLLSTDWFFPYRSLIGIEVESQKDCVQNGCREIVQRFIGSAAEYYHCDFSSERLEETRRLMLALANKCGLCGVVQEAISGLVANDPERKQSSTNGWLFSVVADKLATDRELDTATRIVLQEMRSENSPGAEIRFERIGTESVTNWDKYIRSLTPEIPSTLANFVSVDLLTSAQLRRVLTRLTPGQRAALLARFRSTAKAFTGVEPEGGWPSIRA